MQSTARLLRVHPPDRRDEATILILNAEGFQVECIDDTSAGATLAKARAYQAILLDHQLSGAPGIEVLRRLHDAQISARVIVLAGSDWLEGFGTVTAPSPAQFNPKLLSGDHLPALLQFASNRSTRPEPAEFETWREAVCHECAKCTTPDRLMMVILDALCDPRLTLRDFFGYAKAWRIAWGDGGKTSVTELASNVAAALREGTRTGLPTHPRLQAAIRQLERAGRKQSQSLFARQNGLSRTYLSRLLKAETGRQASEWCRASVMRSAFSEVAKTPEQIKRIADHHGYHRADGSPDSTQFDHDFRNTFGLSPRELRRTWARLHPII